MSGCEKQSKQTNERSTTMSSNTFEIQLTMQTHELSMMK